jgi:hypothetical protein
MNVALVCTGAFQAAGSARVHWTFGTRAGGGYPNVQFPHGGVNRMLGGSRARRSDSSMSSGFVDTAAHVIAIVVIVLVPIVGITVFWLVHILPEKIAEKRHHPQKDAIKTLCLLSLVFGGMLWPLAWLWAYSRPVFHKMAYGTDKHEDFYAIKGPVQEDPVPGDRAPEDHSWKS